MPRGVYVRRPREGAKDAKAVVEPLKIHADRDLRRAPVLRGFVMTKTRLRAAWLLADDRLSNEKIAMELGISAATLGWWNQAPEFKVAVDEYRRQILEVVTKHGIAIREQRVRVLQVQLDKMLALIEARAEAGEARLASGRGEPGEETGLLAEVPLKGGGTMMAFDAQLTKEIRETLKYASQELGQFQQKVDVTSGGQPITFTISMADDGHEAIEGEWTAGGREQIAEEAG